MALSFLIPLLRLPRAYGTGYRYNNLRGHMMSFVYRSSRALCLLMSVALLTCCTGCLDMMYAYGEAENKFQDRFRPRSYTNVSFQVLDGDTLQPLTGLNVGVNNCAMYDWFRDDSSGATDRQGRVTLRVIRNLTPSVDVTADGYMPVVASECSLGADPPPSRVLHLYREPRPYHVLQVPTAFEGTVQIRVPFQPDPRTANSARLADLAPGRPGVCDGAESSGDE